MFAEAQMFGFQTPVIVIAGPAIVYVVLILLTLRRRGLDSWLHGIFFLYLLIGIVWAIGKSLSIAQGLVPLVPIYGALIATDTLAILPVLLTVLTILFLERSGAQWTGVIGGCMGSVRHVGGQQHFRAEPDIPERPASLDLNRGD